MYVSHGEKHELDQRSWPSQGPALSDKARTDALLHIVHGCPVLYKPKGLQYNDWQDNIWIFLNITFYHNDLYDAPCFTEAAHLQ